MPELMKSGYRLSFALSFTMSLRQVANGLPVWAENVWHNVAVKPIEADLMNRDRDRQAPISRIARLITCFGFFIFGIQLWSQQFDAAEIYSRASKSVLLILIKSAEGKFVAQGTGFLVDGNKIVTNRHVVQNGAPMIDLGGVRIPASIQALDEANDIAILTVAAELAFPPLELSDKVPPPGSQVVAIGNPLGLEKSISTGIASSMRTVNSRNLIQITAPISSGSSGGPLFDLSGKVVGVVVSSLEDGQNLNFAIPASCVVTLLQGNRDYSEDPSLLFTRIKALIRTRSSLVYSDEDGSPFKKHQHEIDSTVFKFVPTAGKEQVSDLIQIVNELGFTTYRSDNALGVLAAQRAAMLMPTASNFLLLAKTLNYKASWMNEPADKAEKEATLRSSEANGRLALAAAKSPTEEIYYWLGDTLVMQERYAEANVVLKMALTLVQETDRHEKGIILRDLVSVAYYLDQRSDEKKWFKMLVDSGSALAPDWESEARNLDREKEYNKAGESWWKAAELSLDWTDWCEAAGSFVAVSGNEDKVLFTARKCIVSGSGVKDSEARLSVAHAFIAEVLNDRGVYDEALSHGKEATTLDSSNSQGYDQQAIALIGLHRYQEAINAEKQAIRLSDGKYGMMHFHLGLAYFNSENWQFAQSSFEKAANAMPSSDPSAYNVALCLRQLGMYSDAARWYEEVLRRNPTRKDKHDILNEIVKLKKL